MSRGLGRFFGSRRPRDPEPRRVAISGGMIRLGQLLKLADLADTGAAAKEAIAAGEISVNGETEVRRGRQLRVGDVVARDGLPPVRISDEDEVDVPW